MKHTAYVREIYFVGNERVCFEVSGDIATVQTDQLDRLEAHVTKVNDRYENCKVTLQNTMRNARVLKEQIALLEDALERAGVEV